MFSIFSRFLSHLSLITLTPLFFFGLGQSSESQAAAIAKMVIISPTQSVPLGQCSAPVTVQAQSYTSAPVNASKNITVYFTGSSASLTFYQNAGCTTVASTVQILSGHNSQNFYFKGSSVGSQTVIVATMAYVDGQQTVTINSAPTPSPTPVNTPTPAPTPSATPSPTSTPGGIAGRSIPSPIYGVTLDAVDNSIRPGEITALQSMNHMPTSRVVFDPTESATYYQPLIPQLRPVSYIMGQLLDSSNMSGITVSDYQARAQSYVQTLGNLVDVWEVGNEVNGGWLGTNVPEKIEAAYDVVSSAGGATAITFFWEDPVYCSDGPQYDMFTWITNMFQLNLPVNQRSAETEKIRLGLNYALISWYPAACNNIVPDWASIYTELSGIFPNAKVGFGELGTASPQYGSTTEINMINQYYPLAKSISLPSSYIGGYFWWNFAEEMVPSSTSTLFSVLNAAIK